MKRLPPRLSPIVLVLFASAQAYAAGATVTDCDVTAWSTDKDPAGLNIRAGPGTGHTVIGKVPPPYKVEGETFAAEVAITGSQDGWLRITRAIVNNYITDDPAEFPFEGEGWVSGALLGLWVEAVGLRSEPSHAAALSADFSEKRDGDYGPDYFTVERLHACRGYWVEVEGTYLGKRYRGWTDDTCASQVTTCP
jgi:hypothetical protein